MPASASVATGRQSTETGYQTSAEPRYHSGVASAAGSTRSGPESGPVSHPIERLSMPVGIGMRFSCAYLLFTAENSAKGENHDYRNRAGCPC